MFTSLKPYPFIAMADRKVLSGLLVLLLSAFEHLPPGYYLLAYVIDLGLTGRERDAILKAISNFNDQIRVEFRCLPASSQEWFVSSDHVAAAAYGKLYIGDMFSDLGWALYADTDMIVGKQLPEFGERVFAGKVLGAVRDWDGVIGGRIASRIVQAERLDADKPYFNSGFMLLDLERLRDIAPVSRMIEVAQRHVGAVKYLDQDILNVVLSEHWEPLGRSYNVLTTLLPELPRNCPRFSCNVHTIGRNKPWHFEKSGAKGIVKVFYDQLGRIDHEFLPVESNLIKYPQGIRLLSRRIRIKLSKLFAITI